MRASRAQGTSVPITDASWSRLLSSGASRSIRAASDRAHGRRHLDAAERPGQTVRAGGTGEEPGLDERPHRLLDEERVAVGALDDELLERIEARIGAEQRVEQFRRARVAERLEASPGDGGASVSQPCRYSGR